MEKGTLPVNDPGARGPRSLRRDSPHVRGKTPVYQWSDRLSYFRVLSDRAKTLEGSIIIIVESVLRVVGYVVAVVTFPFQVRPRDG